MVTIILLVSRDRYLEKIFSRLEFLECKKEETNLLTYVDGDLQLFTKVRNLTQNSKFNQRLCVYRKRGIPSVGGVMRRRERIAAMHNELKAELGPADYFFLLEDDTLIPNDALTKLLGIASLRRDIGLVSGIEIGRWGYTHIGAWRVNDVYEPTRIESVPKEEGVQQADATGFYCCIVKADMYFKHTFMPLGKIMGPDVEFGLELRKQGYKNYVDFTVQCTHLTLKEEIKVANSPIDIVSFEKIEGKWLQSARRD